MNMVISVVVCTYNRADLLGNCLNSLAGQNLARERYEVLVVDNNSTDNTAFIAEGFVEKYQNFRLILELHQGVSHARNRGWKEAKGTFVAYIDDDARADADWLTQLLAFSERHPEATVFGGPYYPYTEAPLPSWFPPGYGALDLGNQDRVLDPQSEFLSGTNLVFSRALLETIGGFNPHLGMVGKKIAYGEEPRILKDIAESGVQAYYAPEMRVSHLIRSSKFSLRWLLYSAFCKGRDVTVAFRKDRKLSSHLYGILGELVKVVFRLLQGINKPFKLNVYQAFSGLFTELGALVGCIILKIYK